MIIRWGAMALAFLIAGASGAFAQSYPTRAVKIVVPYEPGGATDIVARVLGGEMSKTLGQPVVVENRPGNSGVVGANVVAKSPPDGYTLCLCTVGALVTGPVLNPSVPYSTSRDLLPVSLVNRVETAFVARGDLPAVTLAELVAAAKAAPGKYTYATSGIASPNDLAFQMFMLKAGINMLHVPYKGDGPAVVALAGGAVDLFIGGLTTAVPMMKAGRVKALAATGLARSRLAPEVPIVAESGFPGYEHSVWSGVVVAAGTPASIVARLRESIAQAVLQPAMREIFESNGLVGVGSTAEEFGETIRRDTAKYTEVQKHTGKKFQ